MFWFWMYVYVYLEVLLFIKSVFSGLVTNALCYDNNGRIPFDGHFYLLW